MDAAIQSYGDMAMTQMTSSPPALSGLSNSADIDKKARDFEAMFVTQMLQPMFDSVSVDPMFGGGHGEEIMRTFLLQEYGKIAAQSGQLGIAASVKNEMIAAQAAASNAPRSNRQKGASYAATQ